MYIVRLDIVRENLGYILMGLPMTLLIAVGSVALGIIIGLPLGAMKTSRRWMVRAVPTAFIEVFRNTPVFVQIVWTHYVLPLLVGIRFTALQSGIIALGLNTAAYLAEVFRGGIQAVEAGQVEAATSLGMTYWQTMRRIVLPQAIRKMLPPFINTFVSTLKDSAMASYIGVAEMFYRGNVVNIATFRPLEILTAVAVIYLVLCFGLSKLMDYVEIRISVYEKV